MSYKTIKAFSFDEFIIKKSRFIGSVMPVKSTSEALNFIAITSKKYSDATHNVFAYRIRSEKIDRCCDDGEPTATAGMPLLDVLIKENLTDICLVATRYFGGILLGGGGLIRAYSHCGKIAIDSAVALQMTECVDFNLICEYSIYGKIEFILPDFGVKRLKTDFSDCICLELRIKQSLFNSFKSTVTELSANKIKLDVISQGFDDF